MKTKKVFIKKNKNIYFLKDKNKWTTKTIHELCNILGFDIIFSVILKFSRNDIHEKSSILICKNGKFIVNTWK